MLLFVARNSVLGLLRLVFTEDVKGARNLLYRCGMVILFLQ